MGKIFVSKLGDIFMVKEAKYPTKSIIFTVFCADTVY